MTGPRLLRSERPADAPPLRPIPPSRLRWPEPEPVSKDEIIAERLALGIVVGMILMMVAQFARAWLDGRL